MRIFFSDVQKFLFLGGRGVREIILFSKKGSVHCREFYCMYFIYIIYFPEGSDYTPLDPGMQTAFFNCNSCYIMPSSLAKGFRYIMYIRFVKNVVYGSI